MASLRGSRPLWSRSLARCGASQAHATCHPLPPPRWRPSGPPPASSATSSFSTTSPSQARKTRDKNRKRGLSTIYRSGPKEPLSVSGEPLPMPVMPAEQPPIEVDPDHGLWQFFYGRAKLLNTPAEDAAHGRGWTTEELRRKSWDDLQKLWWVCVKERNRISTASSIREKIKIGFGDVEAEARDKAVKKTMTSIRHVLTERFYTWEDAVELAKKDPEINLAAGEDGGSSFTPGAYLEPEEEDLSNNQTTPGGAGSHASSPEAVRAEAAAEGSELRGAEPGASDDGKHGEVDPALLGGDDTSKSAEELRRAR